MRMKIEDRADNGGEEAPDRNKINGIYQPGDERRNQNEQGKYFYNRSAGDCARADGDQDIEIVQQRRVVSVVRIKKAFIDHLRGAGLAQKTCVKDNADRRPGGAKKPEDYPPDFARFKRERHDGHIDGPKEQGEKQKYMRQRQDVLGPAGERNPDQSLDKLLEGEN